MCPVPATTTAAPRVKGLAFREFLVWYRDTYGIDALRRAIPDQAAWALVPGSDDLLGILPSTWYSSAEVGDMIAALVAHSGAADPETVYERGAEVVIRSTLRGAYRTVFRVLASPERYVRLVSRLWSMYHDTGRVDADWTGPSSLVFVVRDWAGHHPALCNLSMRTSRYIFGEMGCRDVVCTRVGCVSEGAPACEAHTHWRGERTEAPGPRRSR